MTRESDSGPMSRVWQGIEIVVTAPWGPVPCGAGSVPWNPTNDCSGDEMVAGLLMRFWGAPGRSSRGRGYLARREEASAT